MEIAGENKLLVIATINKIIALTGHDKMQPFRPAITGKEHIIMGAAGNLRWLDIATLDPDAPRRLYTVIKEKACFPTIINKTATLLRQERIIFRQGKAEITFLPVTNARQRLIIAGSISGGKFPLVIIIFKELILAIAGTKRRPAQLHGRRKRHGRTDKFQATEQGAIHLKNTIAVGIEDGIDAVAIAG